MMELAVVGESSFILGFQLAGIRKTYEGGREKIREAMNDGEVGILVLEQSAWDKLDEHEREHLENSIKPVVVVLSMGDTGESLKRLIRRSIGIDLERL